jgi:hypothetical protein
MSRTLTVIPFPEHPRLGERMQQAELAASIGYLKEAEKAMRLAERGDLSALQEAARLAEGILFHANVALGARVMDRELHLILAARENRRA